MYSLLIRHYGMILKLALTTITKLVWLGESKMAHYSKGVHANFLKQDFEWAQKWFWYFNNVNG
jgi:hypothetical protein